MIEPLFPSVNELDVLAAFAGEKADAYALVKETFAAFNGTNFDAWLAEGLLAGTAYAATGFSPSPSAVADLVNAPRPSTRRNPFRHANLEVRHHAASSAHLRRPLREQRLAH